MRNGRIVGVALALGMLFSIAVISPSQGQTLEPGGNPDLDPDPPSISLVGPGAQLQVLGPAYFEDDCQVLEELDNADTWIDEISDALKGDIEALRKCRDTAQALAEETEAEMAEYPDCKPETLEPSAFEFVKLLANEKGTIPLRLRIWRYRLFAEVLHYVARPKDDGHNLGWPHPDGCAECVGKLYGLYRRADYAADRLASCQDELADAQSATGLVSALVYAKSAAQDARIALDELADSVDLSSCEADELKESCEQEYDPALTVTFGYVETVGYEYHKHVFEQVEKHLSEYNEYITKSPPALEEALIQLQAARAELDNAVLPETTRVGQRPVFTEPSGHSPWLQHALRHQLLPPAERDDWIKVDGELRRLSDDIAELTAETFIRLKLDPLPPPTIDACNRAL